MARTPVADDLAPRRRAKAGTAAGSGVVPEVFTALTGNVERVIVGKREQVRLAVLCLLAGGHALIEDVPGVGKTTLAKALATSIGGRFERIQFTPDLLPSDVLGINMFDPADRGFHFRPGPVFSNVLLADEINRATPKTQSALLEVMEERQVTLDAVTHPLEAPFMVLATQNPVEFAGTFPLPEAQLDRFSLRISLGYLPRESEVEMLERFDTHDPLTDLLPVAGEEEIRLAQDAIRDVHVAGEVKEYIVNLVASTRDHADLSLGASPRASIALFRLAQASAAAAGREFVLPDDVKSLVLPVLSHRLLFKPSAEMRGASPERFLRQLLEAQALPQSRAR
ncbi:MAG TPA: MoxR family ATPase [Candidatus Dormibacteraeota bacterium]|jgi:MoxR-like ATPase|nr:MoxR family ATPase [Candidatus Dormibacteraeota bacterium]